MASFLLAPRSSSRPHRELAASAVGGQGLLVGLDAVANLGLEPVAIQDSPSAMRAACSIPG